MASGSWYCKKKAIYLNQMWFIITTHWATRTDAPPADAQRAPSGASVLWARAALLWASQLGIWQRSLSSGRRFDFVRRRCLQRINIESRRVEFPDKRLSATLAIHHKSVETW